MRKDYWKEGCLLLIGLIVGCLYQKHLGSLPIKETTEDIVVIHDTLYVETPIPPLNAKNVLAELKKQGVPHAKIVLAQSRLETGDYKSKLCKTHNNIFGLRKGKSYRKYDSYKDCIVDYKRLISSKYKGGDYYLFLKKIGYAEDEQYIEKLKRIC